MKNSINASPLGTPEPDDMRSEYDVDFSKSRPNKFAERAALNVVLAPDVAQVFTTADAVNKALRAIMEALPERVVPQ